jgi:hypothetical protein
MAGRRSPVTEIREILRRLQLGERARRIARDLGVSRNTVAHYRHWAATHGLLAGPLPEPARLAALLATPPAQRPAQEHSLVEPFGEPVLAWHAQGVEGQAIWQLLVEQHGSPDDWRIIGRMTWQHARPPRCPTLIRERRMVAGMLMPTLERAQGQRDEFPVLGGQALDGAALDERAEPMAHRPIMIRLKVRAGPEEPQPERLDIEQVGPVAPDEGIRHPALRQILGLEPDGLRLLVGQGIDARTAHERTR